MGIRLSDSTVAVIHSLDLEVLDLDLEDLEMDLSSFSLVKPKVKTFKAEA